VSLSIVRLKDQIMNLFLEELNDCIALSDDSITLVDLIFSMKDGLISCCDTPLRRIGEALCNGTDLMMPIEDEENLPNARH
jgi:hypothetical protein